MIVMLITGELSLHRGTKAEARCLAAGNLQSAPPEDLRSYGIFKHENGGDWTRSRAFAQDAKKNHRP